MTVNVRYILSADAQKAAMIKTNSAVTRAQQADIEIPLEQIAHPSIKIESNGALTLALNATPSGQSFEHSALITTWTDVLALLAIHDAELAQYRADARKRAEEAAKWREQNEANRKAEEEKQARERRAREDKAITAFFADPEARSECQAGNQIPGVYHSLSSNHPLYAEVVAEAKRRAAADITARKQFIDMWIALNADETIQQQYADGLLCRTVPHRLIADSIFPPKAQLCDSSRCDCSGAGGGEDVTCLPTKLYPAWRKIKATLPTDTTFTFASKIRFCDDDEDDQRHYVAHLSAKVGPLTITRTVEIA